MADFPNSVKNFLTLNDGVDRIVAAHPNDRGGEITAIETLLGALGSIQSNTESLKNLLININKNVHLEYKTTSTLTLKAGEIAIPDASGNVRWRRNTSDLTVDWGDIDIGVEANNTYYVYAVADAVGTGFIAKISLSSSLLFGGTFYRKIGQFENVAGDITTYSIVNDDDKSRKTVVATGTVSHGGTIPLPSGYTQGQCEWMVGIGYFNYGIGQGPSHPNVGVTCTANSSRVVTVQGGNGSTNGYANYIIIGVK